MDNNKAKKYPVLGIETALATIREKCGAEVTQRYGEGGGESAVILLPQAADELRFITTFGRRSPMNCKETKFIGYGHWFIDDKTRRPFVVVSHFIEVKTPYRTNVSCSLIGPHGELSGGVEILEYEKDEYLANEIKYNTDADGYVVDPFLKIGHSEYAVEAHTHPALHAFFSYTDKELHKARSGAGLMASLVVDPINREMVSVVGKNFQKAQVLICGRRPQADADGGLPEGGLEEIMRLAGALLNDKGYAGSVRAQCRPNGSCCLKLKLVSPPEQSPEEAEEPEEKE